MLDKISNKFFIMLKIVLIPQQLVAGLNLQMYEEEQMLLDSHLKQNQNKTYLQDRSTRLKKDKWSVSPT